MITAIILLLFFIDFIVFANDRYVLSFFMYVAITIGAAIFLAPALVQAVVTTDWTTIAFVYVPVYLAAGAGVAFVKWILYVFKVAGKVKVMFEKYSRNVKMATPYDFLCYVLRDSYSRIAWDSNGATIQSRLNSLKQKYEENGIASASAGTYDELATAIAPQAKENVGRITAWLCQWPLVIIVSLFEDLLMKLGKYLADLFDTIFSRLSAKIVGGAFNTKE